MNLKIIKILFLGAFFCSQIQNLKAPEGSLLKTLNFVGNLLGPNYIDRLGAFLKSTEAESGQIWKDVLTEDLALKISTDKFSDAGLNKVIEMRRSCLSPKSVALSNIIAASLRTSAGRLMLTETKVYNNRYLGEIAQGIIFDSNIAKFKDFVGLFALLQADAFSRPSEEFKGSVVDYHQAWTNLNSFFSRKTIKVLSGLIDRDQFRKAFAQIDAISAVIYSSFFSCQSPLGRNLLADSAKLFAKFLDEKLIVWQDELLQRQVVILANFLNNLGSAPLVEKPTCAICSCPALTLALESLPCHHDGVVYHLACLEGLPRASADGQRHCPQCRGPISLGTILNLALRQFGRQSSELSVKSHIASPKRSRRASIVV